MSRRRVESGIYIFSGLCDTWFFSVRTRKRSSYTALSESSGVTSPLKLAGSHCIKIAPNGVPTRVPRRNSQFTPMVHRSLHLWATWSIRQGESIIQTGATRKTALRGVLDRLCVSYHPGVLTLTSQSQKCPELLLARFSYVWCFPAAAILHSNNFAAADNF